MPYKDKVKDRQWHKEHMHRKRHGLTALKVAVVKQSTNPYKVGYVPPVGE